MIKIVARDSKLSKRQVKEVLEKLIQIDPSLSFKQTFIKTMGDRDRKSSLRYLGKTDFFTKEIDQILLENRCDIAIHSAKDLPNPIPKGLAIAAITKGVDPRDALVMREKRTFFSLPSASIIATSSFRREKMIQKYRSDLCFTDLRGTIEERIQLLQCGVDGVVVAEAALIRLGLTHVNRFIFSDPTENLQGKLAIITQENNRKMRAFFKKFHGK